MMKFNLTISTLNDCDRYLYPFTQSFLISLIHSISKIRLSMMKKNRQRTKIKIYRKKNKPKVLNRKFQIKTLDEPKQTDNNNRFLFFLFLLRPCCFPLFFGADFFLFFSEIFIFTLYNAFVLSVWMETTQSVVI